MAGGVLGDHTGSLLLASAREDDLGALVLIVVLGIGGTLLANRMRVPSIVVLLGLGLLAGPVTGLLDPNALLGDLLFPFVSLAVGVILFEGGLALNVRELGADTAPVVRRLLTVGALVTWAGSAAGAALLLGLPTNVAVLLGAILVVSGPTVIFPLLRLVKPRREVAATLKWEGVFIDPIGAILGVLVFEAILAGNRSPGLLDTLGELGLSLLAGAVVGVVAATLLIAGLRSYAISESLQPTVTLMSVLAAVAVADLWRAESGLIAATLMGMVLANQRRVPVQRIAEFKETLGLLLTSVLFIILAGRLTLDDLESALGVNELLFLLVLVFVVRPAAVALATINTSLGWRERLFLASLSPRGVVAAAVASLFGLQLAEQGVAGAELLAPLTFFVIIGTALISGLAALPIARRLELTTEGSLDTLVIGNGAVAREIARGLARVGGEVTYAPGGREEHEGLRVYEGNLLDDLDEVSLELERFSNVLIASPSDEYNSIVATRLSGLLGRKRVFQLAVERGQGPAQPDSRGRPLFEAGITHESLAGRLRRSGDDELLERWEEDGGVALLLPGEGEDEDAVLARLKAESGIAITANDDFAAGPLGDNAAERMLAALRSAAATVAESLLTVFRGRR